MCRDHGPFQRRQRLGAARPQRLGALRGHYCGPFQPRLLSGLRGPLAGFVGFPGVGGDLLVDLRAGAVRVVANNPHVTGSARPAQRPPHRRLGYTVLPRKHGHRLAGRVALGGDATLASVQ
jgi:hypothetical protein